MKYVLASLILIVSSSNLWLISENRRLKNETSIVKEWHKTQINLAETVAMLTGYNKGFSEGQSNGLKRAEKRCGVKVKF